GARHLRRAAGGCRTARTWPYAWAMPFLPSDFGVPELLEAGRFRLRPLTVHDVVKDYDAVMSSREHLWAQFGEAWGWPPADLTLEQDLIELGWHQEEFQAQVCLRYT